MSFDAFIAIDWSGAGGAYDGIAVARAEIGQGAPRLVRPSGRRWTRTEIAEWLHGELAKEQRLLIGFDFSFSMPFSETQGYPVGAARDVLALWDLIDEAGFADADFGCAGIVADPRFANLYWSRGKQPRDWVPLQRLSETACVAATGTRPETVFKLVGAKQVGKASLTGIRVLRQVRTQNEGRVSVWPCEPASYSVLAEIYPTLFRKQAAGSLAKLRTASELNRALKHFKSRSVSYKTLSDHETDALISAAGLRRLVADGWRPTLPGNARIHREGWICGVPFPVSSEQQAA